MLSIIWVSTTSKRLISNWLREQDLYWFFCQTYVRRYLSSYLNAVWKNTSIDANQSDGKRLFVFGLKNNSVALIIISVALHYADWHYGLSSCHCSPEWRTTLVSRLGKGMPLSWKEPTACPVCRRGHWRTEFPVLRGRGRRWGCSLRRYDPPRQGSGECRQCLSTHGPRRPEPAERTQIVRARVLYWLEWSLK